MKIWIVKTYITELRGKSSYMKGFELPVRFLILDTSK